VVACEERFIPGPQGAPDIRILICSPPRPASTPCPALLNIHGGGYVMGVPEQNDLANRDKALRLGCKVIATSYRLAPETPWPGALEDCYAALCWMHANAGSLGIDPERIAISGESAGGGHAAALAIHARNIARKDPQAPRICFQLLDAPMLDDRTGTSADEHPFAGEFLWRPELNRFGWQALLGREPGGSDVPEAAVPARVADLSGLPPACITIGSLDLFLEESLEYARRLTRAGVLVELHVIAGGFHGYTIAKDAPQVRMVDEIERRALARALGMDFS
jgi:triacylglycerol lipase